MLASVERLPLPRVGEAEVGAAVDDDGVVAECLGDLGRLAVRQPQDHDVVPRQGVDGRLGQHPVGQRKQVWLERAEPLTGVHTRGHRTDLCSGCPVGI